MKDYEDFSTWSREELQQEAESLRNYVAEISYEHVQELRRWERAIEAVKSWYPTNVFPEDSTSLEGKAAFMARHAADMVAQEYQRLHDDEVFDA